MCGIVAVISSDTLATTEVKQQAYRDNTRGQIDHGLEEIRHRGPDSSNVWISDDNRVALGHTRLAIKDLSPAGSQPLHNSHGNLHAIVNGEFYDYRELRQELQNTYDFQSECDSELLLALYERDGLDCFSKLRGEFAFVLYDQSKQLLVAARDRHGVKPLFYHELNGRLLIASEAKAFRSLGWEANWDVRSIVEDGFLHGERTLFKSVRKVLPGHYVSLLSFDLTTMTLLKYHEPEFPDKNEVEHRDEYEMIHEVKGKLFNAVAARTQCDVPMGVYLSGGIDSAVVAGMAAAALGKWEPVGVNGTGRPEVYNRHTLNTSLMCFNVGFDVKSEHDETGIAERTAQFLNLPFKSVRMTEQKFAENFEDAFMHCEHHNPDLNSVAKFCLSELVHENGVKVILSGEGSDEHFGGYPPFLTDFMREADQSFGQDDLSTQERAAIVSQLESENQSIYKGIDRTYLPQPSELASRLNSGTSISSTMIPVTLAPFAKWTEIEFGTGLNVTETRANNPDAKTLGLIKNRWHPLHTSQYIWSRSILPNLILTSMGDRMEMSHSVEGRPCFLDHHLTECANKLPPSLKIKHDATSNVAVEKWVLREAAKDYITPEMYQRKKYPFTAPYHFNVGGPMHKLMTRLISRPNVDALGFVDTDEAMEMMKKAFEAHDSFAMRVCFVIAQWVVISKGFHIPRAEPILSM